MKNNKHIQDKLKELDKELENSITQTMIKFSKLNRGFLSELEIAAGTIARQWIKDNQLYIKDFLQQALTEERQQVMAMVEKTKDKLAGYKIPCSCPKGGMYGDEVCSKCGGTEWVLPEDINQALDDLLNTLNQ